MLIKQERNPEIKPKLLERQEERMKEQIEQFNEVKENRAKVEMKQKVIKKKQTTVRKIHKWFEMYFVCLLLEFESGD